MNIKQVPKGIKLEIFKADPMRVEDDMEYAGDEISEAGLEARMMFDTLLERYLSYEGEEKDVFEKALDDFIEQYQDLKMAE